MAADQIKRACKNYWGGRGGLPMLRQWKSLKKLRPDRSPSNPGPDKWFCLEFHLEACPCERSYCCCSCCRLSIKILLGLLVLRPSISSLLQSATNVITKCDRKVLQNATILLQSTTEQTASFWKRSPELFLGLVHTNPGWYAISEMAGIAEGALEALPSTCFRFFRVLWEDFFDSNQKSWKIKYPWKRKLQYR